MLVGEYNSSGIILDRYIPGPNPDEAALWYSGTGTTTPQWLHTDTQGSTIAWSNGTGGSLGSQAYDPYGQPSAWSGSRYSYTGQLMIPEGQFYHYKARAYYPVLGRFFQTDPAGYVSDVNWYEYAGENPLNVKDPSGLDDIPGVAPSQGPPDVCESACGGPDPPGGWPTPTTGDQYLCYPGCDQPPTQSPPITVSPPTPGFGFADFGASGGGSSSDAAPQGVLAKLKQVLCTVVPSGRVVGVSGSIGGVGSSAAGGQIVQNYKSGQVSAFGSGGFQAGWNGGLNASVSAGYIWGPLTASNSNFSGRSLGASGGYGPIGGSLSTGSGLVTAAALLGASITPNLTGNVNFTSRPAQLGAATPSSAIDEAIVIANILCK
jgi:RHS repeat-associated protein